MPKRLPRRSAKVHPGLLQRRIEAARPGAHYKDYIRDRKGNMGGYDRFEPECYTYQPKQGGRGEADDDLWYDNGQKDQRFSRALEVWPVAGQRQGGGGPDHR